MPYKDFRAFVERLEAVHEVYKLENANWDLEIGALTELISEKSGPALLFDKIPGYPAGYRVMTNVLSKRSRFAMAIDMPPDTSGMGIVQRWRGRKFKPVKPRQVRTAPVMENIDTGEAVNLMKFPVPRYHEHDGGRYFGTGSTVIIKDPDSDWVNSGVVRIMLHDEKTLGFFADEGKHTEVIRNKYYAQGKSCPVVVAVSPEPALYISSTLHIPSGVSELDYAGWLRGEPVEVLAGELTGLPIPACAEIVIEGESPPPAEETRIEGPLGEWTGYYGGGECQEPVIRVKAVYYRNNPILFGCPPIRPPGSNTGVPIRALIALWDNLEQAGVTGIKGVWQLEAGGGRFLTVVSIKQAHAGHAKQAAMVAAGCHGGGYMGRFVIIVDDDIDITDANDVLWAIATRCDPASAIDIMRDCWGGRLDPLLPPDKRAKRDYSHSIAILNACRPYSWIKEFPMVNKASNILRGEVMAKWRQTIPFLDKNS